MLRGIFGERTHCLSLKHPFLVLAGAMLILSLHWGLVMYINSSYLEEFISTEMVGALFTIGSILSVTLLFFASNLYQRYTTRKATLICAAAEITTLLLMAFVAHPVLLILLFLFHHTIAPFLLLSLDVYIEHLTDDESKTGGRRGIILTVMSLASAFTPLISGMIITKSGAYTGVYVFSALLTLVFFTIIYRWTKHIIPPPPQEHEMMPAIRKLVKNRDLRSVTGAHFLLQMFFAWMVIYIPLYLIKEVGFSWAEVGVILFVGLLAYVLIEYPVGYIADRYIGEQEMMFAGFLIMALSTIWISFIPAAVIIPWMVTMFLTRVGASLVEATTESYFFKHTNGLDAALISIFRIMRPLGMVIGALFGTITLIFVPFQYAFVVLGILLFGGMILSLMLTDTK